MSDVTRNIVRPESVQVRPQEITAMRFNGTDASAQSIALWVKENGDITPKSRMNFRAERDWFDGGVAQGFTFDVLGDGGQKVETGDWVVRIAGLYLVVNQATFDQVFEIGGNVLMIGEMR